MDVLENLIFLEMPHCFGEPSQDPWRPHETGLSSTNVLALIFSSMFTLPLLAVLCLTCVVIVNASPCVGAIIACWLLAKQNLLRVVKFSTKFKCKLQVNKKKIIEKEETIAASKLLTY